MTHCDAAAVGLSLAMLFVNHLLPAQVDRPAVDERHAEVTVVVAACFPWGGGDGPPLWIVCNSKGREYSVTEADYDIIFRLARQTERLVIAGIKDGRDPDYDEGNAHKLRCVRVVTFTPR